MNSSPVFQTALYLVVLFALAWPLSRFLATALDGSLSQRFAWLGRSERALCRLIGANPDEDMPWWRYALALIVFHLVGGLFVYAQQRLQGSLPLNPANMAAVSPDSSFNTAVSFLTNTNWQGYSGESTMSYLTQMLSLVAHNFMSAATGMAVAIAFIRGFVRRKAGGVGNAWLDLYRSTAYILLPISLVFAVFLVGQGVIQNFDGYKDVKLTETVAYQVPKTGTDGQPVKDAKGNPVMVDTKTDVQTLPMGPVASQEAIKMLGTNGGGFFNANSAHPYENPTPLSNFVQMLSIFLIPAALVFMFGRWVGDTRQGLTLLGAMTLLFVAMVGVEYWAEITANPILTHLGMDGSVGNMEGKESRFGIVASALFTVITTAASCGAVNTMHDSLMPLGGLVPMWLIKLGEVVFGGVGAGLYGMLIYAILAVFLSGLMIGRTPEYLGKKIEAFEMKMVAIAILATPCLILGGTALSVMLDVGKASMANPGAHGFSEVLYAFASSANNNGSAFAGLNANTPYYNVMLAIAMWFGRFTVIIPVLAIAGKLAAKPRLAVTSGTLPTHGPLFVALLVGTVVIVGALTYIPAVALGPVIEHLQLFGH